MVSYYGRSGGDACWLVDGLIAVLAALFVLGAAICGLSALLSANKYLRADYDEMFC